MRRFPVSSIAALARKAAPSGWRVENGNLARESSVFVDHSRRMSSEDKLVAAVVLERLPVVLPELPPVVSAFREFSFQWQQQYRRHYPQEFLDGSGNRGEADDIPEFEPAPTITEADRTNDRRSLQRALDKRLFLILHGVPPSNTEKEPVWYFPEKVYSTEGTMRQCAEAALGALVPDLSNSVYFVGNAPCGHLNFSTPSFKRFFFRSQVLVNELHLEGKKYKDFAWVSKDEVPEYFEATEVKFFNTMLI